MSKLQTIHDSPLPLELNLFQFPIAGKIANSEETFTLKVDDSSGQGFIRQTNLQPGIQVFDFDLVGNSDFIIPIDLLSNEMIQFFYCSQGSCYHKFKENQETSFIEKFHSAVVHSPKDTFGEVFIKKDEHVLLSVICIQKEAYLESFHEITNYFDKNLDQLVRGIQTEFNSFHQGSGNLKLLEKAKLIAQAASSHESDLLIRKGNYYLILAEHLNQFYYEIKTEKNTCGLLVNELNKITEVVEYIRANPDAPHTIKNLCSRSNLSPAKLQEGFKFMFERTVTDFIRNTRLEKAEVLIGTTDLSISEVVYRVGFTSRSYFCKIFKNKYNCKPKEYRYKTSS